MASSRFRRRLATLFVAAANLNPAIQCASGDISCVRPALKNLFRSVRAGHFVGTLGYGAHALEQGVLTPDPGYVVWIVTLGFCSAMVGRLSSVFITTRLRHPAFIVLTLGASLLVSMFLLIARVAQVEPQWAFSALCPTD